MTTNHPDFDGETYEHELDHERLTTQLGKVKGIMLDGEWHTIPEIMRALQIPSASASSVTARIRDLRKSKFGSYEVESRRVKGERGLWEYRVTDQLEPEDAPLKRPGPSDLRRAAMVLQRAQKNGTARYPGAAKRVAAWLKQEWKKTQ